MIFRRSLYMGWVAAAILLAGVSLSGARADSVLTWDWVLDADALPEPVPDVDYLDLDGFDTPRGYVDKANARGITTICYLSAGTLENWRPDKAEFIALNKAEIAAGRPAIIGRKYPQWPGERWLNFSRRGVFLHLMVERMRMCARKGFAMVEFDNIDGHENRTGFDITRRQAVKYAKALARQARRLGLVAVQKNATGITSRIESLYGALLLEDCVLYRFCGDARPYRRAGKPVFNAEYPRNWKDEGRKFDQDKACSVTRRHDIALIIKRLSLDEWVRRCS